MYIFKIKEFLGIVTELAKVCAEHNLNIATKDYLTFEVEYDDNEEIGRLKTRWGYEIGGFSDEILINNLKAEYDFLIENFGGRHRFFRHIQI